jgi:hypothetical protein
MLINSYYLFAALYYAAFRTPHPNKGLVKRVLKLMKDNDFPVDELAISTMNQCRNFESSSEEDSSEIDTIV